MLKDLDKLTQEKFYVALLTLVQIFNLLDVVILLPLAPTFMREFSITPGEFSILASSYNLTAGIVGFFYSSIADHFNRKKLLIFLVIGLAVATSYCGLSQSFGALISARIIAGIFGGVINSVVYAIISDLIPDQRRGKAVGTLMTSFSITSILGIPLGLAIADYLNWRYTFYFIGVGSIITSILTVFILPNIEVLREPSSVKQNILRLFYLMFKKDYRLPYITLCLFTMSGFMLFPFLSPYAVNNIGIQESELKYLYLVGGIFTVILNKQVGKLTDLLKELRTFIPALILSLPLIYLYTNVENLGLFKLLIISSLFMMMINARFVPVMTLITKVPPPKERGGFMGVLLSLRSFASSIAIAVSGVVISQNDAGKLDHFDIMGYISITFSILGGFLFFKLYSGYYARVDQYKQTHLSS